MKQTNLFFRFIMYLKQHDQITSIKIKMLEIFNILFLILMNRKKEFLSFLFNFYYLSKHPVSFSFNCVYNFFCINNSCFLLISLNDLVKKNCFFNHHLVDEWQIFLFFVESDLSKKPKKLNEYVVLSP